MQLPRLELQLDKRLSWLLILLYLASASVIAWLDIAIGWKGLMLIGIVGYGWHNLAYHGLRCAPGAIKSCWLTEDGKWNLLTKQGQLVLATLRGDSLITPSLTILSFKIEKRFLPLAITLTQSGVDKNAFRRLRVFLKTSHDRSTRTDSHHSSQGR